jgi:hypothetical protein
VEVVPIAGGDAGWDQNQDVPATETFEAAIDDRGSPLVIVTWHDAWFDFDQPDPEDARSDYLVTTVGFLVRHGPGFVSVAQESLPDGEGFRAVTHIPMSVVERIAPLRWPDEGEIYDLTAT